MPRLNIYIPDDLDLALRNFPGEINISRVCAAALRAQLTAKTEDRSAGMLFHSLFDKPNWIEQIVLQKYPGLLWMIAPEPMFEGEEPWGIVAEATSSFLNRTFVEGCQVGVGGGLHMWDVIRRLEQRNIGMDLWALGCGQVDAELPHIHANALVTWLSVLYTPRSRAHVVGAEKLDRAWHWPTLYPNDQHNVKRYVVGSCGMFDADSAYARLLGKEITDFLVADHVMGDFLGVFLTPDGRPVEPYPRGSVVSHIQAADLRELAKRRDTIVLLSTVGRHKLKLIRAIIEAGLCNALITDFETACALGGIEAQREA
jgi:DNA-binding transcriptional regulator LsrR (DeoR family)